MKKFFTLLAFTLQGIFSSSQNCGPLDPVFGNGGKILHTGSSGSFDSKKVIIQPDNKIVHVFTLYNGNVNQFGVLRYKTEGQLDSSFGNNGSVITAVGDLHSHTSTGAIQPDGKIVVVGSAAISNNSFGFALVRYNIIGTLDSSFGSGGKTIAKIGAYYDYPTALAIQPDGKIIVVGSTMDDFYTGSFAIARFNNNGSIDSSFGNHGKIVTHLGPFITTIGGQYYGRYANESAQAVIIQTDGKIVVGGSSYTTQGCWDYYGGIYCNPAFAMVRYNSNGSVDSTFGTNGKVADSLTLSWISSMALQNDGKILVTGDGSNTNAFITRRYNSNGSIDNDFGSSGIALIKISGTNTYHGTRSTTIRPDGRIIVGGTLNINNIYQFAVLRYTLNGLPDSSFNGNGTVFFKIGQSGSYDEITSLGLQGDKIIVGGNSRNNNEYKVVTARLLDSGQLLSPVIKANGPLYFCNGGSVKLSSNETGTLQWYRNNVAINGATDTTYSATVSGAYTVAVTNSKGCGISSPVGVTVTVPFIPYITAIGPTVLCTGERVTLSSNTYGNQWYKDGVAISGSTNSSLDVTTSGRYTTKVTVNGCESAPSNEITVAVNDIIPSAPAITAGGDSIFCSGANVVLTSSEATGNQWYKNGTIMHGSNSSTLNVTSSGEYTCKVRVSGCSSSPSNSIVVHVKATPPQPSIVWDGIQMNTSFGYASYQWLFNGAPIAGSDTNSYKPTQTGLFKVIVTNADGCSNTSEAFNLVVLGVADITIGDAKLRWYPNPAHSILNVDVTNVRSNKLHVELYDVTGRFIKKQKLNQNNNKVSVQELTAGLYQLFLYNGREKTVVKVMIVK